MSEPDVALEVLRQLDEQLHPWGEVGEVPAEDGEYYVVLGDEKDVGTARIQSTPNGRMVTLDNWDDDEDLVREPSAMVHRFRKRWMPAPPK